MQDALGKRHMVQYVIDQLMYAVYFEHCALYKYGPTGQYD